MTTTTNASQEAARQLRKATEQFVAYYSQGKRVTSLGNGAARDFYVVAKLLLKVMQ